MFKQFSQAIVACLLFLTNAPLSQSASLYWHYGVGSNIDDVWVSKAEFYRNGTRFYADRGTGIYGAAFERNIIEKNYYWAGGGGLPTDGLPVPDQALIEVVSFYDRKRYRIKVNLPANLAQKMRQVYQVSGGQDLRNELYFGLAPGGYYEVLLVGRALGVRPDLLLARGIAEEVTDDWFDKKFPIGVTQMVVTLRNFDQKYAELFKQYPVPLGMDWAPIMDAYRAKQPRTDQNPVR